MNYFTPVYAIRDGDGIFIALFMDEQLAYEVADEYLLEVEEHLMPTDSNQPWFM